MRSCRRAPWAHPAAAATLAVAAAVLPVRAARSQTSPLPSPLRVRLTLDAGGARLRQIDGVRGDAGVLGVQLRVAGERTLLTSGVVLAQAVSDFTDRGQPPEAQAAMAGLGASRSAQALVAVSRFGAPGARLRWEAGGVGHALAMNRQRAQLGVLATVREHLALGAAGRAGAWTGTSGGVLRRESAATVPVWSVEAGGWRERGALRLTGAVAATATRVPVSGWVIPPPDAPPPRTAPVSYADALLVAAWTPGVVELELLAGARTLLGAARLRAWGSALPGDPVPDGGRTAGQLAAGVTVWATVRVALTATAGRQLPDPLRGTQAARFAALSVRVAWPPRAAAAKSPRRTPDAESGPRVTVAAGEDGSRLRVTAPGASLVEVMGSFTEWEPRPLTRDGDDAWVLAEPLASGMHRLAVRVDGGAWRVPANLPRISDDFGGAVGLLTVP